MISSFFRAAAFYLILVAGVRLMGKRQIGQMAPPEFVVTMLVANLASAPIEHADVPMLRGVVPVGAVLLLERLLSGLSARSLKFRRLLCGKPVILVENGKILEENLRKTRVTLDELSGMLREKSAADISEVACAILETSGTLSVFPQAGAEPASAREAGIPVKPRQFPVTLVSDGRLVAENLPVSGKTAAWVAGELKKRGAALPETLLLTVDGSGRVGFQKKRPEE